MLPLMSKTSPTLSGASSLENCWIFCSTLSSEILKFSFSSPVTKRFSGSVTVTGMSTTVVSTRMFAFGSGASDLSVGLTRGSMLTGFWSDAGDFSSGAQR